MQTLNLQGEGFNITTLTKSDFEPLYAAASDALIWAGHPAKTRHERAVFGTYFDFLLGAGGSVTIRETGGRVIGCSRFYEPPETPGGIAIGYSFLVRDHWGGASNRAVKTLMLNYVFRKNDEVWFHIDPSNIRSQKATAKLGAYHVDTKPRDLGNGEATWMRWVLPKARWKNVG